MDLTKSWDGGARADAGRGNTKYASRGIGAQYSALADSLFSAGVERRLFPTSTFRAVPSAFLGPGIQSFETVDVSLRLQDFKQTKLVSTAVCLFFLDSRDYNVSGVLRVAEGTLAARWWTAQVVWFGAP